MNHMPVKPYLTAAFLAIATLIAPAQAGDVDGIHERLVEWTDDFNAGRTDRVCDLFSKEVIARYRGQPERDYDAVCKLLKDSLADPARDFHYALDLHEIIVEGDLAVVRLTWRLRTTPPGIVTAEPGMDVFRREADGKWRIIRYLAFEAP